VIERAAKLGIDLLTLKEAKQIDWTQFRPKGPSFKCWLKIQRVELKPHVGPIDQVRIVCSCGRNHGTPEQFAASCFWQTAVEQYADVLTEIDADAATKEEGRRANVKIGNWTDPNHVRRIVHGQLQKELEEISFDLHFSRLPPTPPPEGQNGFAFSSHVCGVDLVPAMHGVDTRDVLKTARIVCSCCGKDHGAISDFVREKTGKMFRPDHEAQRLLREAVQKSPNGIAHLHVAFGLLPKMRVVLGDVHHRADELRVRIHGEKGAAMAMKQFELTRADGESRRITQFESTLAGKKMTIVMPDGMQSKKICLRIGDGEKTA
jgi:hypothetical protein